MAATRDHGIMMEPAMSLHRWSWVLLLLAGLAGCSRSPASPTGTGAKEAAQRYFDALLQRDWSHAYAALHPDSQRRCTHEQFSLLAEAFRRNLGFDPETVHVRACEEQGTEAIAHVVLTGRGALQSQRYRDGITLRQDAGSWRVILQQNFGRKTK